MSSVDDRIVNMKFNNAGFQSAVDKTIGTLGKLKEGLNLKGAASSLTDLGSAASGVDFSSMGSAIEGISLKFGALATIGITALSNITNKAVDAGLQMAKSLAIDPITQGFGEYELKMGSIQTIMAGTGASLDTVNGHLKKLNEYSDKTIYSFQDMTQNIGKFTNAGVDLDTAVASIQGISNVAAVSGANAEEASRAMYNFSQALSAGSVKLMDWKSIENANMATVEFKTALLDSAVAAGTLKKSSDGMYKTIGKKPLPVSATKGFNESLTEQWMTTEVLNKTLGQYSDETTELGKKAFAAAQDVKTFTQLVDTLQEGVGSGWAQTWELVFGNFDEAKALWTGVNDTLGEIIDSSSDARNALLEGWKEAGGREALLNGLSNAFKAMMGILKPIGDAFKKLFPPMTAQTLYDLTVGFEKFTAKLIPGEKTMKAIQSIFEVVFTVLKVGVGIIGGVAVAVGKLFGFLISGSGGVVRLVGSITNLINRFRDWAFSAEKVDKAMEVLGDIQNAIIVPLTMVVTRLADAFAFLFSGDIDGFKNSFSTMFEGFEPAGEAARAILTKIGELLGFTQGQIVTFANGLKGLFSIIAKGSFLGADMTFGLEEDSKVVSTLFKMRDGFEGLWSIIAKGKFLGSDMTFGLDEDSKVVAMLFAIRDAFGSVGDAIANMSDRSKNTGEKMKAAWSGLGNAIKAVGDFLAPVVPYLKATFDWIKNALSTTFGSLDFQDGLALINTGLFASLYMSANSFFKNMGQTFEGIKGMFEGVTDVFGAMETDIKAGAILKIAVAILILAGALWLLSTIEPEKLVAGGVAIGVLMVGMNQLMKSLDGLSSSKSAVKMPLIAASLLLLALALGTMTNAVKILGEMKTNELVQGGIAISVAIGIMIGAAMLLDKHVKSMAISANSLRSLALSLMLLAIVIKIYSSMDMLTVAEGLAYMGTTIGVLGLAMHAIPKTGVASLMGMSVALMVLALAMKSLAGMDPVAMETALTALGIGLLVMAVALSAIDMAKGGVAGLLAISVAVIALAIAMTMLGALSLEQVGIGLLAIVAVLAVVAGVSILLAPAIPIIALLAGAIGVLGIAILAIGLGISLFATGLVLLGTLGAAGAAGITVALMAIGQAIPLVAQQVGLGIIAFAKVIGDAGPVLIGSLKNILLTLISAVGEILPELIDLVISFIEDLLVRIMEMAPKLYAAGLEMIVGFIGAFANNIGPIIDVATDLVINFLDGLAQNSAKMADAGMKTIIDFINSMSKSIETNAPLLRKALVDLAKAGITALTEGFGTVGDVAKAIIDGLVNGLKNGLNKVKNAAKDVAKSAWEGAKNLLGIASPSKLFKKMGEFVNQGFIKGLKGKTRDGVYKAFDDMKKQLTDLMDSTKATAEKAEKALSKLSKARKKDRKEIAKQKKILAEAKAENKKATNARNTLTKSLVDERNTLAKLASKYESLTERLENARGAYKDAIQTRDDYKNSIKDQYKTLPDFLGNATLQKNVDAATEKYDKLTEKVEAAATALQEANQKMEDSAQAIKDQFSSLPSITEETSSTSYIQSLKDQIEATEKFNRDMTTLRSMGLDNESYEQLLAAGLSSQGFIDSLIDGGPAAVAEIDKLNNVLAEESRRLGVKVSEELHKAGADSAKALYGGLETELKKEKQKVKDSSKDLIGMYVKDAQATAKATNKFRADIERLRALGLNDQVYEDMLAKGLDAQPFIDDLLKSGKSGVNQVNNATKDLTNAANALGNSAAKALYQAGVDSAKGIVAGLEKEQKNIQTQMNKIADGMVKAIKKQLGIKSPSRILKQVGIHTGEGLIVGLSAITPAISKASSGVGDSMVDAMQRSMSELDNVIPSDMTLNPTIRPVLDLSSVAKSAEKLDGMLGNTTVSATSSYRNAAAISADNKALASAIAQAQQAQERVGDSVTFVQNNNSPKALSTSEIYRQTKNQISKVKGALSV